MIGSSDCNDLIRIAVAYDYILANFCLSDDPRVLEAMIEEEKFRILEKIIENAVF